MLPRSSNSIIKPYYDCRYGILYTIIYFRPAKSSSEQSFGHSIKAYLQYFSSTPSTTPKASKRSRTG